jgi:signal transduction histidine kinase
MGFGAAGVFLLALIVSGLSSSAVGTMAGQIIMQGFVRFPIPVWVRRIVTMLPSFVAVAMGVNVTQALVLSQVVLSLVLPIPMIALLILTRRADVMGRSTNGRCIGAAAIVAASVVIGLNILLIVGVCGVALPWPSGLAAEGELTGSFVVPAFLLVAIVALLSVCAGALLARVASSGDGRRASFAAVAARIGGSWGGLAVENARLRSELDQARTAVAAKNRALAAAGHDLMQPVQSIVLCLDRMRRRVTEGRDREQVDRALREAEWLGSALERLNTMSRLDHGAITPNLAVVPIAEMLIDVAATYEGAAEAKRLALRVVPSRLTIRSDRDLLLTILQNFVGNAVKYTAKGGVLVGCRRRGGRVWIEVHDTGIGIPAHQIDAAFEAYRRLSTDGEGLGLGLSIVRHLADLLGHRVAIRSRPGKGSCFAIEVALAEMTGDRR